MEKYSSLFEDLQAALTRLPVDPREAFRVRGLTEQQVDAICAPSEPRIVVHAGAGTGKTTTLVERIAWLLRRGVQPRDLLVCTFTRNAAEEMTRRVQSIYRTELPYCATIHALALKLLGGTQELARRGVQLLSDEEYLLEAARMAEYAPESLEHLSPAELLLQVQRAHEEQSYSPDLAELAERWDERLRGIGRWDFGMLLTETLREPPRRRFRHLLVDEAQDLSALQLNWLAHHQASGASLYLVGDENQSLYSFRGSLPGVLADQVAAGAKLYSITENFRCARSVLEHANNVIAFNSNPLAQPLAATRTEQGLVEVRAFENVAEEVEAARQALHTNPSHVVLVRTRELTEPFRNCGLNARTIHESKGLEWDHVWVAAMELGVLPHVLGSRAEERRLCYVAMTRARQTLTMSYVRERAFSKRTVHYSPSPFLFESQALRS